MDVPRRYREPHGWAVFVVVTALIGIVAGANVTSTASGDAIPTWPHGLSADTAKGWVELSHRFAVSLPLAGTLILLACSYRDRTSAAWRIAKVAALVIVFQAVLGGVRVILGQQSPDSGIVTAFKVVHASLGQVFFTIAVAAAALSSAWWRDTRTQTLDDTGLSMLRATSFALVVLLLQVVLGALGRHGLIPREVHSVFALVVLLLVARLVLVATGDVPRDVTIMRGPASLLGFLAALQLVFGVAAYLVTASPETVDPEKRSLADVITLNVHVVLASTMLGLVVLLLLRTIRTWGLPTPERVLEARRAAEGNA